jgi:hypothetical protein
MLHGLPSQLRVQGGTAAGGGGLAMQCRHGDSARRRLKGKTRDFSGMLPALAVNGGLV